MSYNNDDTLASNGEQAVPQASATWTRHTRSVTAQAQALAARSNQTKRAQSASAAELGNVKRERYGSMNMADGVRRVSEPGWLMDSDEDGDEDGGKGHHNRQTAVRGPSFTEAKRMEWLIKQLNKPQVYTVLQNTAGAGLDGKRPRKIEMYEILANGCSKRFPSPDGKPCWSKIQIQNKVARMKFRFGKGDALARNRDLRFLSPREYKRRITSVCPYYFDLVANWGTAWSADNCHDDPLSTLDDTAMDATHTSKARSIMYRNTLTADPPLGTMDANDNDDEEYVDDTVTKGKLHGHTDNQKAPMPYNTRFSSRQAVLGDSLALPSSSSIQNVLTSEASSSASTLETPSQYQDALKGADRIECWDESRALAAPARGQLDADLAAIKQRSELEDKRVEREMYREREHQYRMAQLELQREIELKKMLLEEKRLESEHQSRERDHMFRLAQMSSQREIELKKLELEMLRLRHAGSSQPSLLKPQNSLSKGPATLNALE